MGGRTPGTWKPGIPSPNPKGRPSEDNSLTGLLRKYMESDAEGGGKQKDAFIRAGILHALKGDPTIYKYLFDRLDGPMKQELLAEVKTITVRGPKPPDDMEPDTPAPTIITPEATDE